MPSVDLDTAWSIHPRVSVRPEEFGALLYHFETRQLSFLKDPALLNLVSRLSEESSVRAACDAVGISPEDINRYAQALDTLAQSGMIVERVQ